MPLHDQRYLSVSELNALVRSLVEDTFPEVTVLGEISNFKRHTSGHLYFTLKDAEAQLRAVCFRSDAARVSIDLQDGMQVLAAGRATVYEPYGQYQLVVHSIEDAGVGILELEFRRLKEKLEKEGLFDAAHKKPLPAYPFRIAVVTSPTGAAVRDILSTLERRWPVAEVLVCPVPVQGAQAAPAIVHALERLAGVEDIDLVIIGRGGGSLEDLWAFNEESVARAVYACPLPIVSAVGHETDFTISDFVADVRAATPTMAAEIAVPRLEDVRAGVDERERRLVQFMTAAVELGRRRLGELVRSYALGRVRGRVEGAMQTLDYAVERLVRSGRESVRTRSEKLNATLVGLDGLDPRRILSRGYVVCSDAGTGRIVRSASGAVDARGVHLTFSDGRVSAEVKERIDGD
jgi:exodeoxyribonuclease VII large subunit